MQVSAVPQLVTYVPVQPIAPVARRDADSEPDEAAKKVRAANPPGVGARIDLQA